MREVVEALVIWPLSEPLDGSVSDTARFLAMAVQTRSQMVRSLTREMQYKEAPVLPWMCYLNAQ
ncbi:hypothetical protein [Paraburkholderia sp. MM5482-R1]|uniref:hypothetical protein n=1 Tax=unclassified Paraburkholderia TaxID=2615204 RepID=UPI003D1DA3D9